VKWCEVMPHKAVKSEKYSTSLSTYLGQCSWESRQLPILSYNVQIIAGPQNLINLRLPR